MAFACFRRRQREEAFATEPHEPADGSALSAVHTALTYKSEAPSFPGYLGRRREAAAPSEGRSHEATSHPLPEWRHSRDSARPYFSSTRRISSVWCCLSLLVCYIHCIVKATGDAHHHEKNPAAKSLALRKKTLYAPQPLAGEVLLSCPFGFDMVEGDCVKAEIMKPQLICPYGSFQNQQGACLITDSVLPERVCPSGFEPYEKGCIRKTVIQPLPLCPPLFHTSDETGALLCVKPVGEHPQWICDVGVPEGPVCVQRHVTPPSAQCPDGFVLEQGKCIRWIRTGVTYTCPPGFEALGDPQNPVCYLDREVAGIPFCRPPFILQGGVCIHRDRYEPVPICPEGFHYDKETGQCRRVRLGRAVPQCKEGWVYLQERNKCVMEEEPTLICPAKSNHFLTKGGAPALAKDGCAEVETETPVYACHEGETAVFVGSDDRSGALPPAALPNPPPAQALPGAAGLAKGLGKHHKGKGGPVPDWGPPPSEGPLEDKQGGLLDVTHDKSKAPLGVGKGLSKHHKGKGGSGLDWGPPRLPPEGPVDDIQQEAFLRASFDKGEPALPPVATPAARVGKGLGKHHKGKGGKGVDGGQPIHSAEGTSGEQQGVLLGPVFHDKSKAADRDHHKKAVFTDGALLAEEGFSHTKDETQLTGGPPADGSPTSTWQRRAWGPFEAAVSPLGGGEGNKGAPATRDEGPSGKEPPITGKEEKGGPPHIKEGAMEAGKGLSSKTKGKEVGPPVIEGPQMLCETLEVSLEALRLECPPGSTPTVSKVLGGQSCREIKRQPAEAVCETPGAELQVDGFCLWQEKMDPLIACVEPETDFDLSSNMCVRAEYTPATPICPAGLVFEALNNMCGGFETLPPNWTCPEGFLLQHAVSQDPKEVLGDKDVVGPGGVPKAKKKGKKAASPIWGSAQCEQVELAAVQIVCPGFFLVGGDCVKHTRAEPTAVDTQGSAFPCVLRGSGVSCGHKGPWITEIREELVGDDSHFGFDTKKNRRGRNPPAFAALLAGAAAAAVARRSWRQLTPPGGRLLVVLMVQPYAWSCFGVAAFESNMLLPKEQ
ncbi:hypothetical protein ACSSS7_007516 [Eimeria intestinalis]